MSADVRILIADDHPIYRRGLVQVIQENSGLKIVAEAEDGETALARIVELRPQVAIVDVEMPKMNGFDLVRALTARRLTVAVIVLTMHSEEAMLNQALDLGVSGYLIKDSAVLEVVNSIRAVCAGQRYVSPSLSGYLIRRRERATALAEQKPGLNDLTPSELRILRGIAQGKTSKEIADEICVSYRTVENHRAHIASKLDLHGSHALLRFALDHKSELG